MSQHVTVAWLSTDELGWYPGSRITYCTTWSTGYRLYGMYLFEIGGYLCLITCLLNDNDNSNLISSNRARLYFTCRLILIMLSWIEEWQQRYSVVTIYEAFLLYHLCFCFVILKSLKFSVEFLNSLFITPSPICTNQGNQLSIEHCLLFGLYPSFL